LRCNEAHACFGDARRDILIATIDGECGAARSTFQHGQSCDRFFDERIPLIGRFIAPFRDHHREPDRHRRHGFCERNGNSCKCAYLTFVSFHAVFIHANVRFDSGALRWLIVTPQFHHWHHSAERDATNRQELRRAPGTRP
jgi:hypothetical protein